MNKFIKVYKKNELEDISECSLNELDNNNIDKWESNNNETNVVRYDDKSHLKLMITIKNI